MRGNPVPSVYQGGYRCGKLNGRYLKGLAEGNGSQLHQADIFQLVHDRSGLSRQIHIGFVQKPELIKISVIIVRSQTQPHRNKNRVAGIHGSLDKGFCPVT